MQYPAWAHEVPDVVKHLKTDVKAGLTDAKVEAAREVYGWNELDKEEGKPLWKLVLEQFDDTLVKILLLAACVSFGLAIVGGDAEEEGLRAFVEPLVILLILILNAIVGVWQESNAEKALDALKEMQSETAKCYRNGTLISDLPARELVPGDIIELRAGDRVPADIRVVTLNTATLMTEQASLTGESVAVNKSLEPVGEDVEIQAKECMLFAGTAVANGSAVGVVTDIGMATEIGKIQDAIQEAAQEEDDTPLKKKLDEFGEMLTKVIGVICLVVWVINYKHFPSSKTPICFAIASAVSLLSPVMTMTRMPAFSHSAIAPFTSSRGGSSRPARPHRTRSLSTASYPAMFCRILCPLCLSPPSYFSRSPRPDPVLYANASVRSALLAMSSTALLISLFAFAVSATSLPDDVSTFVHRSMTHSAAPLT